jgi:chemotaxis protein MotA
MGIKFFYFQEDFMDIATLSGFGLALLLIIGSIAIGPGPLVFINVPSALVVIGGTIAVTILQFSFDDMKVLIKIVGVAFKKPAYDSPRVLIDKFIELSNISRREGILALEKQQVDDPFMKKGIDFCVDGAETEKIEEILSKEIDYFAERHDKGGKMLDGIKEYAPAFGMIGTLIGLVQMLNNLNDPSAIGPGMAVALITTLYGAILANVLAGPVAKKLKIFKNKDMRNKEIIYTGIEFVAKGENPKVIEQILRSYLEDTIINAKPE